MTDSADGARKAKPDIERVFETGIFAARWLMAPIYAGLVLALAGMVLLFVKDAYDELSRLFTLSVQEAIMLMLTLIDVSLVANLMLIVIFSGYENFVSKIDTGGHEDRPGWMGTIDFNSLKMKLITSMVAISGIALLRVYIQVAEGQLAASNSLGWLIALHMTFVVSGVLMAVMDLLSAIARRR